MIARCDDVAILLFITKVGADPRRESLKPPLPPSLPPKHNFIMQLGQVCNLPGSYLLILHLRLEEEGAHSPLTPSDFDLTDVETPLHPKPLILPCLSAVRPCCHMNE